MAEQLGDTMDNWRAFIQGLPAFTDKLAITLANNAKASIEGRIRGKNDGTGKNIGGVDAQGQPLKPYSPAYLARKKRLGRFKGFTDLDLSGDMWNNTGTIVSSGGRDGFEATIAGRSRETQDKLDWNSERYGNVLAQSKTEVEELEVDLEDELDLYMRDHKLIQ